MEPFTVSDDELEAMFIAQNVRANTQAVADLAPLFNTLRTLREGFIEAGFSFESAERLAEATYLHGLKGQM